jgi:hypothetical protein
MVYWSLGNGVELVLMSGEDAFSSSPVVEGCDGRADLGAG